MNVDAILSEYNVLITGASGFIGTVLLQRLLNVDKAKDCKIFCLLRCGKKYSSVTQRLRNEILANEIMELSQDDINDIIVNERVIPLEGELTSELLGFDHKAMSKLKYSHNSNGKKGIAVIHCAADIDFNREINASIDINVYGTYQCVCVANEIEAKSFIHISTLYVNSREHRDKIVKEQIYDSGIDFVKIFQEWLALKAENKVFDEEYILSIKAKTAKNNPSQRQQWPNSYTFTKNMAENVVRCYCSSFSMPSSIIRLGIVSPIHRGSHLGWFMGNGGFVFLVIGIATGNIRYLYGDGLGKPDFVPVDYTVDTILSVTANTVHSEDRCAIYQCGVIANAPKWNVDCCVQYIRPKFIERDLPYCKKNPNVTFISSKALFFFIELILYEIPLFLLGVASFILSLFSAYFWIKLFFDVFGYRYDANMSGMNKAKTFDLTLDEQIRSLKIKIYDKPYTFVKRATFMKRARQKLNWFNSNYSYFVNQRWFFDHSNVKSLYASLDEASQKKYDFDVERIDFNKYACDSALVCFDKYINYKDAKKKSKQSVEEALKNKLSLLEKQREIEKQNTASFKHQQRLSYYQILDILRKLFFMLGLDRKVSFCIFFGMSMVAVFSFFVY